MRTLLRCISIDQYSFTMFIDEKETITIRDDQTNIELPFPKDFHKTIVQALVDISMKSKYDKP